jgi:hypothetical protein
MNHLFHLCDFRLPDFSSSQRKYTVSQLGKFFYVAYRVDLFLEEILNHPDLSGFSVFQSFVPY